MFHFNQYLMSKKESKNQSHTNFRQGSVVIITGASSGLGKQLAFLLSKRNIRLIITGRDEKRLNQVSDTCKSEGIAQINTFIGDLTSQPTCRKLIDWAQKVYNRIDCMILNAGVNAHFQFQKLGDTSVFQALMRTNFYANVYLTRYSLPLLKRCNGIIVVISSLSGKFGLPSRSAYCASKFALTGFFQSLRTEINIPIMMVYPTSLETPMQSHSLIKSNSQSSEKRQDPKKCAQVIVKGIDEGVSDIYLPWKGWLGVVLQPLLPNLIRWKLKQAAKL